MSKKMEIKEAAAGAVRQIMQFSEARVKIGGQVVPMLAVVAETLYSAADGRSSALDNLDYCADLLLHVLEILQTIPEETGENVKILRALDGFQVSAVA